MKSIPLINQRLIGIKPLLIGIKLVCNVVKRNTHPHDLKFAVRMLANDCTMKEVLPVFIIK